MDTANPSEFSATGIRKERVAGRDTKRFPVETVSWDDCVDFCRKLSNLPVERREGRVYRLPTEAQWEYACRAGSTGRYGFSPPNRAVTKESEEHALVDYGWFGDNRGTPHPVGQKWPNGWGLYDMHGNVYQWCRDWYDKDYYGVSPTDDPSGPAGPASTPAEGRVVRGGCWIDPPGFCRAAFRYCGLGPGSRLWGRGFRISFALPDRPGAHIEPPAAKPSDIDAARSGSPIPDLKSQIPHPLSAIAPFDAEKAKEHQEAWAENLDVPVEITNSIGIKLVLIPPGEFQMGSSKEVVEQELKTPDAAAWYKVRLPSERPLHRVQITRPFRLGRFLVTQGEYQRVIGKNPSWFSTSGDGQDRVAGQDTKRFPVENVSWDDAVEFCRRLSDLPAEKAAGRRYRLPSEAEWEYACRAGSQSKWHCGDQADNVEDCGWFKMNSGFRAHIVGQLRANPWGLFDMDGNVWEWCHDWYEADYYMKSAVDDPCGPSGGSRCVLRGGSAWQPVNICRPAVRHAMEPGSHIFEVGFRVSLLLADNSSAKAEPLRSRKEELENRTPADQSGDKINRKAAEYALAKGGTVRVAIGQQEKDITAAVDLPTEAFHVVGIVLDYPHTMNDADLAHFAGLKYCRNLMLCPGITDEGLKHVGSLPRLESLSLRRTGITGNGLRYLEHLSQLSKLLLFQAGVTDEGLLNLRYVPTLENLELDYTGIGDNGLEGVASLPQLKFLAIHGTWHINGKGFHWLSGLKDLEQIWAGYSKVNGEGLEFLHGLPRLRLLELQGTLVDDAGAAKLPRLKNLSTLLIGNARITIRSLDSLKSLPNLKQLHLGGFQGPADAWIAGLLNFPPLEHLALEDKQISDKEIEPLARMKTLRQLGLAGTKVTAPGVAKLQAALPGCHIIVSPEVEKAW